MQNTPGGNSEKSCTKEYRCNKKPEDGCTDKRNKHRGKQYTVRSKVREDKNQHPSEITICDVGHRKIAERTAASERKQTQRIPKLRQGGCRDYNTGSKNRHKDPDNRRGSNPLNKGKIPGKVHKCQGDHRRTKCVVESIHPSGTICEKNGQRIHKLVHVFALGEYSVSGRKRTFQKRD